MSVIVTGARGLLGSEVINLSSDAIGIASTDCNLIESASLIEKISRSHSNHKTVIHCAARVGGDTGALNSEWVNLKSFRCLLR